MEVTIETVIADIERYCNNYFNGDYPPEFLSLAEQIKQFREENSPTNIIAETVVGLYSWTGATTTSGAAAGWKRVFADDLAVYKKLKTL